MSGTSLDGLDIAYCHFIKKEKAWNFAVLHATTIKYSKGWSERLSSAQHLSGEALVALDNEYGKFLGKACQTFVTKHKLKVDFIASHGHTIFHQPQKSFTLQIGNGNALYAACGIPVVYDFRSLDVQLGGEGAPLVPVGDKLLFSEYDTCLNLGGIANLSMEVKGKRSAYDICFVNMCLNYLMGTVGKSFDSGGQMASQGSVDPAMLKKFDKVYATLRKRRSSLGREIFERQIKPILDEPSVNLKDKLRTVCESAAKEIAFAIVAGKTIPKVLCTGGGTFNSFFVSCLLEHCGDEAALIIPEENIVKFKEALVFAFLGVLRIQGKPNCLKSVTGATKDSSGGVLVGL